MLCTSLVFIFAHFCWYCINLLLLFFLVNLMGYPHQLVQFFAVLVVAPFLFYEEPFQSLLISVRIH